MNAIKSLLHRSKDSSSSNGAEKATSSTPTSTTEPSPTATPSSSLAMSAAFKTILIVGGTSGIGEAFAKRFHSQGKKVIVTGRREARLNELKSAAAGIESYVMDNTDLAAIPKHLDTIFATYPDIDTVWVNGGIQKLTSIKDLSSSSDADVSLEITTNFTAPCIIGRHVIPKLIARGSETNFLITSSGLGFVPAPLFPVYNATKAAIHLYMVSLRQSVKDTKVNIIEIVPPYVATELDTHYKDKLPPSLKPMALKEFEDEIFAKLDSTPAKDLKEVAAGTATPRVESWRGSIGEMLAKTPFGG